MNPADAVALAAQAVVAPTVAPHPAVGAVLTRPSGTLRFLADICNRGDSREAMQQDYAAQLRADFPAWLEDNKTRTVYEWHPSMSMPPPSLEDFLDPQFFARFLEAVPQLLQAYGVEPEFSEVLSWDMETFTSRPELSAGTPAGWDARFPGTPFWLGFEMMHARVMAEFARYAPRSKRCLWSFPWCAPWMDIGDPASRLICRTRNAKTGPALARSMGVLNPAMYPFNTVATMQPIFDEVAFLTNQVRAPGMEAFADVSMTYPTGALPPELQHNQPGGGASVVPLSAEHFTEACEACLAGRLTGVTLWGPIWDRADFEAKQRWLREVFTPVSQRYASPSA